MKGAKLESGIIKYSGAYTPGWVSNLGLSLSGGTLTITDVSGNTLTSSNPGWVTVPSTTAGQLVTLKVTTSMSFNDDAHASSDLTNLGFGITEANNWANDMPFFIHVINRGNTDIDGTDGNSVFAISRSMSFSLTPAAANSIGDTDAIPVTDNYLSVLIMASVTTANYTSLPAQLVGGFRMQWSSATADWTVQTLSNLQDGFGFARLHYFFNKNWTYPTAQNGAATGTHLLDNGGTAPVFSSTTYGYKLTASGLVHVFIAMSGDGGTDGVGAVVTRVTLPLPSQVSTVAGAGHVNSVTTGNQNITSFTGASVYYFALLETAGTNVQNGDFGNGNRSIQTEFSYRVF
jgi:hypothetical protein